MHRLPLVRNDKLVSYFSFLWQIHNRKMSRIVSLDVERQNDKTEMREKIAIGTKSLLAGNVIAVPTDTVYGVAGLAQNSNAVNEIYNIKNRNYLNPIAISVGDFPDIYKWSKVSVSDDVLRDLLPGPVTVVMTRSKELNPALNPNTDLVGIRIPDNDFIRGLCDSCKGPIALTSANSSGSQSTLAIEEFQNLWPKLDVIFDGGCLSDTEEARLGSTVVDLSVPRKFRIIRKGSAHQSTVDLLKNKYNFEEVLNIL